MWVNETADGKKCTSEPKYIILLHTNFSYGNVKNCIYGQFCDLRFLSLLNIHLSNQNDSDDAAWVLGPKWCPYGDLLSQKTWRFPQLVKKVSRFISDDLIRFHKWGFTQGRIKLFGAPRQWKHFRPLFQAVFLSGWGVYPPPQNESKHHASQSQDRNNKYFILYIEFCINNKI